MISDYRPVQPSSYVSPREADTLARMRQRPVPAPRRFDYGEWAAILLDGKTIGYVRQEDGISQPFDRMTLRAGLPERSIAKAALALAGKAHRYG